MGKIIGGSAFGRGDALVDTTDAVFLDSTNVALLSAFRQTGMETVIGLELGGRINKSTERRETLYLLNADGAAERADPTFLEQLLNRIAELPRKDPS